MNIQAIITVFLILFTVIDIFGSLPVILTMKRQGIVIHSFTATLVAGGIMILFLIFGLSVLNLMHIELSSFALAGSLIIFFIGLEMILGIRFFRDDPGEGNSGTVVPIAFPLVAGAGTLTTIISLKAEYDLLSIILGIVLNLILVLIVLKSTSWLSRNISPQALATLRKVFGIILISIAIQMFKQHF